MARGPEQRGFHGASSGLAETHLLKRRLTEAAASRFWSKIEIVGECWLWTKSRAAFGHGLFWDGEKLVQAHRWAWEHRNGPVPDGLNVLHHCDVPACVRPEHLFVGVQRDNVQDAIQKGRMPHCVPGYRYPSKRRGAGCATRTRTLSRAMAPKAIVSAIPPTRPGR